MTKRASMTSLVSVHRREFDLPSGEELAVTDEPLDFRGLEQPRDTAGQLADDRGFAFLHLCDVDAHIGNGNAVLRELVVRPMEKLGRFEKHL